MMKSRLYAILFSLGLSFAFVPDLLADQQDGYFHVDGIPNNTDELQCTCGGVFTLLPDNNNKFSITALWLKADTAGCPAMLNPVTHQPDPTLTGLKTDFSCQLLNSNDTSVNYANLTVHAIGMHCLASVGSNSQLTLGSGCYAPWAVAGEIEAQSVLPNVPVATQQTTPQPNALPPYAPTPLPGGTCVWLYDSRGNLIYRDSKTCYNSWEVYVGTAAGSITVSGAPVAIGNINCNQGVRATVHSVSLTDNTTVIDFETIHKKFTTDASVIINSTCALIGTDGQEYGEFLLSSLDGTRTIGNSNAPMWSAQVTTIGQPAAATHYQLSTASVDANSSSDSSGTYHNLWTAQLAPSSSR